MRLICATILSLVAQTATGDISLALPIDCELGETCHIQQTVDHDPTESAFDFTCGLLTYDGHKGTDFALPSLAAQAEGVDVLAAAPGTVRGVRDGMPDVLQVSETAPDIAGRECGNGVVVSHGDGWETQYCHLAQGSISVRTGDTVAIGTVLGQVGLSGETQFPHLHLSVRQSGQVVDPFDPDGAITCNAISDETLWTDSIALPPGGFISAGFSASVPEFNDIKAGEAHTGTIAPTNPMVVWGYLFGGKIGDEVLLTIAGPTEKIVDQTVILERNQAQLFRASGRRAPAGGWDTGDYVGTVQIVRDGAQLDEIRTTVTVR